MPETFGARVRRLRNEQGIAAADLAIAARCSEGAIRQLETGSVKSPNFLLGLRLADALHVDPYYLAMGEGASLTERLDLHERWLRRLHDRMEAVEKRK